MAKTSSVPTVIGAFETDFYSLEEALPFFLDWRARLEKLGRARMAQLLADGVSTLLDNTAVSELAGSSTQELPANPLLSVETRLLERQERVHQGLDGDHETDFSFRISLHPHEEGLFGSLRSNHSEWSDAFLEGPHVERAPVWRAIPGHPIHDVLERRIRIWQDILSRDPSGDLQNCGFNLDLTPPRPDLAIWEIVNAQRDFDTRLDRVARHVFQALFHTANLDALGSLQTMTRASEAATSTAGKQWLASIKAACAPRLTPRFDAAMVLGGEATVPGNMPEIRKEGEFRSR